MKILSLAALALGALLSMFVVAPPAEGQRARDLAPQLSLDSGAAYPEVERDGEVILLPYHIVGRDRALVSNPVLAAYSDAASTAGRNATLFVIGGALTGAAIGTAILFAPAHCRTAESMCGLLLPVAAGGGAAIGAFIGYLIGTAE